MSHRSFAAIFAGIIVALPVTARAQTTQLPLQDRWPGPAQQFERPAPAAEAPAETPPAQAPQAQAPQTQAPQAQAPQAQAPQAQPPAAAPSGEPPAAKPAPRRKPSSAQKANKPAVHPASIACSGVFARESSHAALSSTFEAKNVTFTEVEGGPDGNKLTASVLFPDDPKRRLEVLWQNEEARSDTFRIVITGKSTWVGPMGLHLGMPLAAVEKINGKPFKLRGFDQSNAAAAIDWQDGALASVPGGCSIGVFFTADPKVPESARAGANAEDVASNGPAVHALKPTVTEILIGYSQ